ncbi:hypothetical protein A5641_09710, partial [Mycobacterium sp. 1554424.7]
MVVAAEALAAASANLSGIGSSLRAANAAAAGATTQVAAAADDEVSAAIAALFGSYAQDYQALSAQTAAFHDQFVGALKGAGGAYAFAEAANASPLQTIEQDILGVVNAPTQTLLGRPLIGNGTNAAPGSGLPG